MLKALICVDVGIILFFAYLFWQLVIITTPLVILVSVFVVILGAIVIGVLDVVLLMEEKK